MCGILGCVYCRECRKGLQDDVKECVNSCVIRRGPDCLRNISVCHGDVTLDLVGSVLSMRPPLTPQPINNVRGDLLLWNGEVFGGLTDNLSGNDSKLVLEALSATSDPSHILNCLASIHGPWATLYWQNSAGQIWFGRDVFGRRSLLWHLPSSNEDCFALCSASQCCGKVLPENFWAEVPAHGLFCMTLSQYSIDKASVIFYPWIQAGGVYQGEVDHMIKQWSESTCIHLSLALNHQLITPFPSMNKTIPTNVVITNYSEPSSKAASVKAAKLDDVAGQCSYNTLNKLPSGRGSNAVQLLDTLQEAVIKRVTLIPDMHSEHQKHACHQSDQEELGHRVSYNQVTTISDARVAILFSGGVDSMVLAALVDRCLPLSDSVDLINVAFQQKSQINSDECFNVPDRITALDSLAELNPKRVWNLIMVNVSAEELSVERDSTIRHLVHPLRTVLDDSIGCALWFAARGRGLLYPSMQPYWSAARCVLVGIGADEQLAGYARHRTKYRDYGWKGLIEEVEMDVKRISHRNLGRDDRCIGDHGREARFPFLDENVVSFLQSVPMSDKVDFNLPRGEGEKLLLRDVARLLGCAASSRLPKRAIQFGSRIAKLEGSSKELASDICDRLQHKP